MVNFDDFPYAAIREAMSTVVGRVATAAVAMVIGTVLAAMTASESMADAVSSVIGLPWTWVASCLSSYGFFVFPAILVFSIAYIRLEWPHWPVLIVIAVMWWNIHGTIRWTLYDSPLVKKLNELQGTFRAQAHTSPVR